MPAKASTIPRSKKSFRFRGRSFLALVLAPERPFEEWFEALDAWAERSKGYFVGRPIVLDVLVLRPTREELATLLTELGARDIRLMGIEGVDPSWLGLGMPPPISGGRPIDVSEVVAEAPAPDDAVAGAVVPPQAPAATRSVQREAPSLLIDEPVRSGQSVIYPEGDVTILGSVASGAEVVAGGSIHIYGALRGRAIAGSTGNPRARIFCRKFEAELLAIDGLYKTADDMQQDLRGQPIQAWLDGDTMMMAALG